MSDAPELKYFPPWIAAGRAGEMKYLEARDKQGRLKRESLAHAAPWARSVVVCALNYNTEQPYSTPASDSGRGWISRYAWGHQDYHDSVMRRLRRVETELRNTARIDDIVTAATSILARSSSAWSRSMRESAGSGRTRA